MKRLLVLFLILFGSPALAESNSLTLALPSAPGNYQSDKFRAGDLDCSNAIGSATNLELGVTGMVDRNRWDSFNNRYDDGNLVDMGLYARIVIPLGKRVHNRVDCSRLYELELRKKQLEVIKLEQELKELKALAFED